MLRRLVAISAVALLALWMAPSAGAAVIFADDFEAETSGPNASLTNWTVSDGTIDVVGTGFFPELCTSGSPTTPRCVDMDGSTADAGVITSPAFSLDPGSYTLSFWAAGNQRNYPQDDMTFAVGSSLNGLLSLPTSAPWTQYSFLFSVLASESASIVFNHAGADNVGIVIDNVLLESNVAAVPEPMSLTLFGTGMAALAYKRRRAAKV
jgi:hypothetical protein